MGDHTLPSENQVNIHNEQMKAIWFWEVVEIALYPTASIHSLGVLLDSGLLLNEQVPAMTRSTYQQLGPVCQLHPFLDKRVLALVIHVETAEGPECCGPSTDKCN